jgi:DNA polymerase III subunit gamma/tau
VYIFWKGARAAESNALEMRRTAMYRGFKSHPFRCATARRSERRAVCLKGLHHMLAVVTTPACPAGLRSRLPSKPMSYQSLYRRYRSQRFSELKGQEHVANALRNAVRQDTVLHAYLFSGPRGTGKTSSARILAKALNCTNLQDGEPCCECDSCVQVVAGSSMDVIELDAASNNGVDAMRELVSRAALGTAGHRKVYIVDEVHMLSTAAANALLKTLEEPPDHVVFVLATTDPQKVLPTIISRTQHFEFRLAALDTLSDHLQAVATDAGIDLDADTIMQVARKGNGSFRDALSALDQVAALGHLDQASGNIEQILSAVGSRDAAGAIGAVGAVIDQGRDPRQVVRDLIGVLRECFLSLMAPDLSRSTAGAAELGRTMGTPLVVRAIEVLGEAGVSMRDALDPRVNLEVALVKLVRPDLDSAASAIMARLDRLEAGGIPVPPATIASAAPTEPASAPPSQIAPAPPTPKVVTASPTASPGFSPEAAGPTAGPTAGPGASGARAVLAAKNGGRSTPTSTPTSSAAPAKTPPSSDTSGQAQPVPAAPGGADLVGIKDAWMAAIDSRMTKAMFTTGTLVSLTNGVATFALPNEVTLQRCRERVADVAAALSNVVGSPTQVGLIVDAGGAASMPPDPDGATAARAAQVSASSPAASARSAITNPTPHQAPRTAPGPDDDIDISELTDAPETSPIDAIMSAFPGAEIVESP